MYTSYTHLNKFMTYIDAQISLYTFASVCMCIHFHIYVFLPYLVHQGFFLWKVNITKSSKGLATVTTIHITYMCFSGNMYKLGVADCIAF